jgi:hypothetical protein
VEYDKAKMELDKATEATNSNNLKKRSTMTEVKQFKEQRDEVRRWERANEEKVIVLDYTADSFTGSIHPTSLAVAALSPHQRDQRIYTQSGRS